MLAIPGSIWERYRSLAGVAAPWILIAAILLIAGTLEGSAGLSGFNPLLPSSVYLLLALSSLWLMYRRTSGVLDV